MLNHSFLMFRTSKPFFDSNFTQNFPLISVEYISGASEDRSTENGEDVVMEALLMEQPIRWNKNGICSKDKGHFLTKT